jgi:long-chain acyl-CoA synthetase
MLPSGNLKIIDRKKDLVKLSGGEYVSLNKVETCAKLLPFIDNCCVIADSFKTYCVLLTCPNVKKIREYIRKEDENLDSDSIESMSIEQIVDYADKNKQLMQTLIKEFTDNCLKNGLERFEVPTKIKFVKETWMPDSGLVTDSLKLKRKEIEKFYQNEIQNLYK